MSYDELTYGLKYSRMANGHINPTGLNLISFSFYKGSVRADHKHLILKRSLLKEF